MEIVNQAIPEYLKEIKREMPAYDIEYLGSAKSDKFQDKILKNKSYVVIPLEEKIKETLD